MSCGSKNDSWNQITFPCHDHKKLEKVFHVRSAGKLTNCYFYLQDQRKQIKFCVPMICRCISWNGHHLC